MVQPVSWQMIAIIVSGYLFLAGAITALIALVWRMHSRRVDRLEENAGKDRDKYSKTVDNIYNEIKALSSALNNFRVHSTEEFVNKGECRDYREALSRERG